MKNKSTILFVIALLLGLASAKAEARKEICKGYYITLQGDTVKAKFRVPIYPNLLKREPNFIKLKVEIVAEVEGKKRRLTPGDTRYIFIDWAYDEDIELVFIKRVGFLPRVYSGEISVFKNAFHNSVGFGGTVTGTYQDFNYVMTREGYPTTIAGNGIGYSFKKKMSEYFKDCPELVKRINKKEFKAKDTIDMVKFYHTQCNSNK